jgi:hypothetical protein
VVINPGNGPGPGPLPDANYTREIPRLNAKANVRTVGYVSTVYTTRDVKAVMKDINVYSAWADHGLGMQGIFLDETPGVWEDDSGSFLENVASSIRSAVGLGAEPLVSICIHVAARTRETYACR